MDLHSNQFKGLCKNCGGTVFPGQGNLLGKKNNRWEISHSNDCTSPPREEDDARMEEYATPPHEGDIDKDYHG